MREVMKTDVELRQLRVFLAVAESGAHARAARLLGISQSTISETLSALERTLGTAVFRKAARGSVLTPTGEALLQHARRMLEMSSELVSELAKVSTSVSGTLVVAAVESVSAYLLAPHLAALRTRWPKARLEVVTGMCGEIRDSVAAGKSDLGLILEADSGSEEDSILARTRLVVFGSPSHRFAGRTPTPDDLRSCDFYMSDAAGDYHQILKEHFEAAQLPGPRIQVLGTIEGVKRGVLAGVDALGLLPVHALEQELRDGMLAEVGVAPALRGLAMRALLASGSASSPIVEDLTRSLRAGSPRPGAA